MGEIEAQRSKSHLLEAIRRLGDLAASPPYPALGSFLLSNLPLCSVWSHFAAKEAEDQAQSLQGHSMSQHQ